MSFLTVFNDQNPSEPLLSTRETAQIAASLKAIGVRFEQWSATSPVNASASQDEVIQAYQNDINRLKAQDGYSTVDVISLAADNPAKNELRKKFLDEHTHGEDEVRFFVRGDGLFYLHVDQKVFAVLCEKGDLISVPANVAHWFDMGDQPNFTAIRLFNNPEGWVANYTGNDIATRFPKYEDLVN
ncbi:MAG: acireductone dioxygenase [Gammaproteobacteria bacterium]|nr:MAG: acireductone dioxygenase [Gammaproteobacteria bacterium]